MKAITIGQAAEICEGTYIGTEADLSRRITGVQTDSRELAPGDLFVAIPGERVDGHKFVADVLAQGAAAALCQKPLEDVEGGYILVDSTVEAMQKLAEFYRKWLDIPVVGITGSVGKTSTKEMIAAVLGTKYSVLKTEGNHNNGIGLPLTIFDIEPEHEVAVLEMGISDFGEMEILAAMAKPDICVITNIGWCHLENLKTREGILKAKTECFTHLRENGTVVLNGDDDMLAKVETVAGKTPLFYGTAQNRLRDTEVWADQIENHGLEGIDFVLHTPVGEQPIHIPIPGIHNVYNALAAATVGLRMNLSPEEIRQGVSDAAAISGRTNVLHVRDMTVIDDCYNANPVSMKAALDVLSNTVGRKIAVLGDMGELGTEERALHREVGRYAGGCPIDLLFCAGELAEEIADGARERNEQLAVSYDREKAAMLKRLLPVLRPGDTVLVKASHFMNFSELIEKLMENKS
ncbi:MAG: UDP-N-acetylmuramoyl-tripeptide--D-alanyl-D-alanine ligase [Lachnospiraceae bacterium]|nr:UDP-N-acetylmuramoyl-tripeptide--D-alanyl-D-alanine ligase [Lachnospiraceae bacterium]